MPNRRALPTTAATLRQLVDQLDHRTWLHAHADDWQPGYPGGGQNEGRSKGAHADPTLKAATTPKRHEDMLCDRAKQFIEAVDNIVRLIEQLEPERRALTPMTHTQAQTLEQETNTRRNGAGTCLRCNRLVTGVDPDRLRAGYCPTCYQQWLRLNRPDRGAFERGDNEWQGDNDPRRSLT